MNAKPAIHALALSKSEARSLDEPLTRRFGRSLERRERSRMETGHGRSTTFVQPSAFAWNIA
jgi:hypothetical protein